MREGIAVVIALIASADSASKVLFTLILVVSVFAALAALRMMAMIPSMPALMRPSPSMTVVSMSENISKKAFTNTSACAWISSSVPSGISSRAQSSAYSYSPLPSGFSSSSHREEASSAVISRLACLSASASLACLNISAHGFVALATPSCQPSTSIPVAVSTY